MMLLNRVEHEFVPTLITLLLYPSSSNVVVYIHYPIRSRRYLQAGPEPSRHDSCSGKNTLGIMEHILGIQLLLDRLQLG